MHKFTNSTDSKHKGDINMMKAALREEEKVASLPRSRISGTPGKYSANSNDRRNSTEPFWITSECDNVKAESDRKVLHGFFIDGIQRYYQDRLDKRISLATENNKIVYVTETIPEIIISDGEFQMYAKIDNATKKDWDIDIKDLKNKYIKLNDWSYTVKMESLMSGNEDFTKILINIK